MCKHEKKDCPRCNTRFECKPGDVAHCQCYGIILSIEQRASIEAIYSDDCLCYSCLREISLQEIRHIKPNTPH